MIAENSECGRHHYGRCRLAASLGLGKYEAGCPLWPAEHVHAESYCCGDRMAPSPDTPPFGLARLADPHPPDAPRESLPLAQDPGR